MKHVPSCPNPGCPDFSTGCRSVIRWGTFRRLDDSRHIQRFRCKACGKSYSRATFSDECWQKKRRINRPVWWCLASKMSRRRMALLLKVTPATIARKLVYLAKIARRYFTNLPDRDIRHVQFDEIQSSVHTKCKPVGISAAVDVATRRVIGVRAASMPAQHPLIEISKRKYGPLPDHRDAAIRAVLTQIKPMFASGGQITTDRADRYPGPIREILPGIGHINHLSRRGRSTSAQGELKRIGKDPLFPINHAAAMSRDGVGPLVRKTWGNAKRIDRLEDHVTVWAHFHNEVYLPLTAKERRRDSKVVSANRRSHHWGRPG